MSLKSWPKTFLNWGKRKISLKYWVAFLVVSVLFAGGLFTGLGMNRGSGSAKDFQPVRDNAEHYNFINPLLFVDNGKDETPKYKPLEADLNKYIDDSIKNDSLISASVYFRDFNSGVWTGVNEDDKYEPSSMLKVAIMMAYLREAEKDPLILAHKLYYQAQPDSGQHYQPEQLLTTGYHEIQELIQAMIIESDNIATVALISNNEEKTFEVYQELHLPLPPVHLTDFMSARSYSVIFRTLYNSTFLSRNISEQILQLLTYTKFTKGLVAGVPNNIVVAHKFGEHTTLSSDNTTVLDRELHDCGIVYYPGHPYLLCVMTKGNDFSELENAISDISRTVYLYVKNTSH